jgi:hypothetical protein
MTIQKIYLSLLIAVGFSITSEAATTVSGAVNVDNRYMVVLSQGGTNTIMHTGPRLPPTIQGGALITNYFSAVIDDTPSALKNCNLILIAWGDGTPEQGLAAIVKGNNGKIYTGGPGIRSHESSVSSRNISAIPPQYYYVGDPPTQAEIDSMISGANYSSPHEIAGDVAQSGTAPWGVVTGYAPGHLNNVPLGDFQWIWSSSNLTQTVFHLFTIDCNALVKPGNDELPSGPLPMPPSGEHYQCYGIETRNSEPRSKKFVVKDQFSNPVIAVGKPIILCNPSFKNHNNKEYPILREERHLVCYELETNEEVKSQTLEIETQFAKEFVISGQRQMFCAPALKRHTPREGISSETKNIKK